MKTKVLMAAVLSGLVLVAGAAQADGPRDRPDFATLDLNGDGALSLDEMQAQGEARFAAADANGDGALSAQELIAAAGQRAEDRAAKMIERLDANEDGVLQMDEMPRQGGDRAERMFERVDADGDGVLSQDEFETAQERRGGRGGHGGKGGRDRG
ncbi:EF-hand domain-containing protein [Yoonia sp.]|uniref:EF-hand domain-containing protein n=1 Tax=Yoonia sp. TaxID=2212373 RepID=UPI0023B42D21